MKNILTHWVFAFIRRVLFALGSVAWLVFTNAHAASFDCKKAKTEAEKTICGNAVVSKLDQELAKAYREAVPNDFDKTQFQKDQKNWLKWRDFSTCGKEAACLDERYQNRLVEIRSRSFCRDVQKKLEASRTQSSRIFMEAEHESLPGVNSSEYIGLDIDKDGKPDKIVKSCGAQECGLYVDLASGETWNAGPFYPFIVSLFQSKVLAIHSSDRNADPSEEKKNRRSVEEITPSKLQSLCPAI